MVHMDFRLVASFLPSLFLLACGSDGVTFSQEKQINRRGVSYTGELFNANEDCKHLITGIPSDSNQLLCRTGYAAGFNYQTKLSDWVSYILSAESVSGYYPPGDFMADPDIPINYRALPKNYASSGYDRGHLAPDADMDFSFESMEQSYFMSNISPQLAELNRGPWFELESWIRSCILDAGELHVISGPVFTNPTPLYIENNIRVPDSYYKVILKPTSPAAVMAFLLPNNQHTSQPLTSYQLTVNQVEQETGLNFFTNVRQEIATQLEDQLMSFCSLPGEQAGEKYSDPGFSCENKTSCAVMSSCQEAVNYLNICGLTSLDKDGDGLPCETLCN